MSEDKPKLLTVSEAAAHLGIHEKRLRRLLTRTEYRDRTGTGTRTTRTGERRVSLLPVDLLTDIEARLLIEADGQSPRPNGDNGDGYADRDIENGPSPFEETGTEATGTRTAPRQVVLSAFYERLLQEKDARIVELAADKEQLYRLLGEAQANLAREQALRALPQNYDQSFDQGYEPPPSAADQAPEEASEETTTGVIATEASAPVPAEIAPGDTEWRSTGVSGMVTPTQVSTGHSEEDKGAVPKMALPSVETKPEGTWGRLKDWFLNK